VKRAIRKAGIGHRPGRRLATFRVDNSDVELRGADCVVEIEALAGDPLDIIRVVLEKGSRVREAPQERL